MDGAHRPDRSGLEPFARQAQPFSRVAVVAHLGHESGKPNFLWVDYKNNIALHRVVKGKPADHRLERLATPTPLDNRISFGCINVPVDFFEQTVLPAFKSTKGIVYILPEIKATRDFFSNYYDVDK